MKIGVYIIILVVLLMVLGSLVFTAIGSTDSEKVVFTNGTDDLIQRYDSDSDGVLSFKDFVNMETDARFGECPPLDNLRSSFNYLDSNDDGVLSDYELSFREVNELNEVYSRYAKKVNS